MLVKKMESKKKLAMKIITGLAVGVFALSGLALTGCSPDPKETIKEQFLQESLFTEGWSNEWTEAEPFELEDFQCEVVKDSTGINHADITAKAKNNICEITAKANTDYEGTDDNNKDLYSFDFDGIEVDNVYMLFNKAPEEWAAYDPDFDNQVITFEDGDFKSVMSFKNPPELFKQITVNGSLSKNTRVNSIKDSYYDGYISGEVDYGLIAGTYKLSDSYGGKIDEVVITSNGDSADITMKCSEYSRSWGFTKYTLPAQTVTAKNVKSPADCSSYFHNLYEIVDFDAPDFESLGNPEPTTTAKTYKYGDESKKVEKVSFKLDFKDEKTIEVQLNIKGEEPNIYAQTNFSFSCTLTKQ